MSPASIVAFAALFVTAVAGQAQNCPSVEPMPNFESSRLSGDWLTLRFLSSGIVLPKIRCVKLSVQVDADGVFNTTMSFIKSETNEKQTKNAISTPIDGIRSKFQVLDTASHEKKEVIVLDTDYDNYFIWISCLTKDGIHGYNIAVTSRQNELTPESLEKVGKILKAANITGELNTVQQTNC